MNSEKIESETNKLFLDDVIEHTMASSLLDTEEFFRYTMFKTASRFKCGRCGKCCNLDAVMIFPDDIKTLSEHLGMTKKEFKNKYISVITHEKYTGIFKHKKPCIFQNTETNKCTIYEARPSICVSYPFNAIIIQETGLLNTIELPNGCIGIENIVKYFNSVTVRSLQLKHEGFSQVLDNIHATSEIKKVLTEKLRKNIDNYIENIEKYTVFKDLIFTQQVKTGKNRPKHLNTFE